MRYYKVMLGAFAVLLMIGSVTGCNTFRGMGQDVQKGGQAIEGAASR